jgi:hypothetical protein
VFSLTSSGFQPNITWPVTASPSVPFVPLLHIQSVKNFSSALFTTAHQSNQPSEDNRQAVHIVDDDQQVVHIVDDDQQADHTAQTDQQTVHIVDDAQQAGHIAQADQQAVHTTKHCSGEGLRGCFIDLHLQYMEFLAAEMRLMRPFETLLLEDWEKARNEVLDTFLHNSPYGRLDHAQRRSREISDNFLKSSDATQRFVS